MRLIQLSKSNQPGKHACLNYSQEHIKCAMNRLSSRKQSTPDEFSIQSPLGIHQEIIDFNTASAEMRDLTQYTIGEDDVSGEDFILHLRKTKMILLLVKNGKGT